MTKHGAAQIAVRWLTEQQGKLLLRGDHLVNAYKDGPMATMCKDISTIYFAQAKMLDEHINRYRDIANAAVNGASEADGR